jgi:hypothetical protein
LDKGHHANPTMDQKMLPMYYNKYCITNLYLNLYTMKVVFCLVATSILLNMKSTSQHSHYSQKKIKISNKGHHANPTLMARLFMDPNMMLILKQTSKWKF